MYLYICYLLCILTGMHYNFVNKTKFTVLASTLVFCSFIVFITEILSVFNSLNLLSIIVVWVTFSIVFLTYLIYNKSSLVIALKNRKSKIREVFVSFKLYEKILLFTVLFFISILLFQGIIYPPNNWDSLTYHMSRIMFWLGNESVSHFPSHILRHLYQPPFGEFFILHINVLNGNDYFSNSVQLFFLALTIVSIWALLDCFKIQWFFKLLSAFLVITIPSVLLQATTTKNDIICTFFIITVIYFCIKSYQNHSRNNFLLLGTAIGLALLTKGTSYLFLLPVSIVFGIFMSLKFFKNPNFKILQDGTFALLLVLALNGSHYYRNYKLSENALNIDKAEAAMYSNDKINGKLLFSNILKNVGLHLGYPIENKSDEIIRNLHSKIHVSIDNPQTNYYSNPYQGPVKISTHEDLVPNLMHVLLIAICFAFLAVLSITNFSKYCSNILLGSVLLFQIVLFAGYLKWQPWHTRLHIPMFLISVPLIILTAQKNKWFKYVVFVFSPFLAYGFCFYTLYNNTRPLITDSKYTVKMTVEDSRYKKYFSNRLHLYPEYLMIVSHMYDDSPNKVGLSLGDWEYPIVYNNYYKKVELIVLNVANISNKIPQDAKNINGIVTDYNSKFIEVNGEKFVNQTQENIYIWYYKK